MNRNEVLNRLKDLLDKIDGGSLILSRRKNYTEEEVEAIEKELLRYLNKNPI